MEKVRNLVVGCGLSGAVLAERLATQRNEKVLVIDRRSHIAGNIYDQEDPETGIVIHRYGPHVFHTNEKQVWDYLSRFTEWRRFMYRVKAFIDGREVPIPFNLDSLHHVFPRRMAERLEEKLLDRFGFNRKVPILELRQTNDNDLGFLADYVYEKIFLGYTVKQWGVPPEDLDPSVSGRVPVYISRDDRYFQDKYQGIPVKGYTAMVANILDHPLIEVRLNTDFKDIRDFISYDRLFYSGAIDEFYDYEFGELPYRSLHFDFKTYPCEYFQSGPQINFPENYDYTRSVEYKYYLSQCSDKTIVSYEYPCPYEAGKNERYYPVPDRKNQRIVNHYTQQNRNLKDVWFFDTHTQTNRNLKNVWFFGRLGDYKYYNMDQSIFRALQLFREITK